MAHALAKYLAKLVTQNPERVVRKRFELAEEWPIFVETPTTVKTIFTEYVKTRSWVI